MIVACCRPLPLCRTYLSVRCICLLVYSVCSLILCFSVSANISRTLDPKMRQVSVNNTLLLIYKSTHILRRSITHTELITMHHWTVIWIKSYYVCAESQSGLIWGSQAWKTIFHSLLLIDKEYWQHSNHAITTTMLKKIRIIHRLNNNNNIIIIDKSMS